MERKHFNEIVTDIGNMGIIFFVPIFIMALGAIYTLLFNSYYGEANEMIQRGFGVFSIPFVILWNFYLFNDLLASDSKEILLSLPYRDHEYGIVRVIKFTGIYIALFYIFYCLIAVFYKERVIFQWYDIYLPIASILFYSSLSFFIMVLIKDVLISFVVVAVHGALIYGTRGGASAYIYPFQWFHPNPYFQPQRVALTLFLCTLIFYILGHILFTKREYLMR